MLQNCLNIMPEDWDVAFLRKLTEECAKEIIEGVEEDPGFG